MDSPLSAATLAQWTRLAEQARADKHLQRPLQGVIDVGIALTDQEQLCEHDLMFLKGDEVVVLQALDGHKYLGYCEGVIGSFDESAVEFSSPRDIIGILGDDPDEMSAHIANSSSHISQSTPSLVASPSTDWDHSSAGHEILGTPEEPLAGRPFPQSDIHSTKLADLDSASFLRPRPIKLSTGSSDGSVSGTPTPSSDDRTLSIIFDSYRYSLVSTAPNAPILRHPEGQAEANAAIFPESGTITRTEHHEPSVSPVHFGAASALRSQLGAKATVITSGQEPITTIVQLEKESTAERQSSDACLPANIPRLSEIFPKSESMSSLGSIKVPVTPSPTTTMFPHNIVNEELEAARRLFSLHFKGPVSASSLPSSSVETIMRGRSMSSLPDAPMAKHRSLSARRKSVKGLTISSPIVTMPSLAERTDVQAMSQAARVALELPKKPEIDNKPIRASAIPIANSSRTSLEPKESTNCERTTMPQGITVSQPGMMRLDERTLSLSSKTKVIDNEEGDELRVSQVATPSSPRRAQLTTATNQEAEPPRRRPIRPISVVPPLNEDEAEDYRANETQWIKILSSKALSGEAIRSNKKLRTLATQGLPSSVRARVWARLVETDNFVVPGLYQSLCEQESTSLDDRIDRDVLDISADYPRIANDDSTRAELAAVVKAIVRMDQEIRYSTALVFFAGVFLSQFGIGEPTFWTCIAVLTRLGYRRYFTRLRADQDAVRVSTLAFGFVLEKACPDIAARFVSCQIDPSTFFGNWVSTLFVTVLPWSSCLRVVDLVLLDPHVFNTLASLSILKSINLQDAAAVPDKKMMLQLLKRPPAHSLTVAQILPLVLAFSGTASNEAVKASKIKPSTIDKALHKAKTVIENMDAVRGQ
ncbi:hypothetical protein OIV83_004918 [Microbotryomycetes sp. JL201]|nr:hypothetical protein OIV83_004918 [Microbotryomycetes sp. JL201]